ncbi:hypothetical protein K450DRAFT_216094 [Umbelopsis ramanniana AG]|uniref:glutathione transferase n=1 Tax=Umbelopsis ramanniana AG TaxID=1314678 RepID=A0AAD5E1A8_UMBRA|nr:uncharacterized protein K450DRAFT_216094 [Umbelopsis ramanniana AG]KAI8575182.1 hypothetical protein K450DRAFT_216094 [Umbelopsis ramanniana AG]
MADTTPKVPETPLILHHLNNSRSQRILWLLEELNVNYEIKFYQRQPDMMAPKELKDVHSLGKSPVITDGRHTIAESGAIVEYLVSRYGNGKWRPAEGTDEQLQYTYWLHTAEGSLMLPLLLTLILGAAIQETPFLVRLVPYIIRREINTRMIEPNLKAQYELIEEHLSKNEWFAGSQISGADIQMVFPIDITAGQMDKFIGEHTRAWLEKVRSRPAYIKAMEKGGPFDMQKL